MEVDDDEHFVRPSSPPAEPYEEEGDGEDLFGDAYAR